MFNFFRKSPKHADQECADLSTMLCDDLENPTYMRELLDPEILDFSIASLQHVDAFLDALRAAPPQQEDDVVRVVLHCGAYVGEVSGRIRQRNCTGLPSKKPQEVRPMPKGLGFSAATAGILWRDPENMCFPLAKVCKFIENGREDSVFAFARIIVGDRDVQL